MLATTLTWSLIPDLSWTRRRGLPDFEQDRADDEYYAVGSGRQERIVEYGTDPAF